MPRVRPNAYDVGDQIEIAIAPSSANGPGDPTQVKLIMIAPDRSVHAEWIHGVDPEITREVGRAPFDAEQIVYWTRFTIPSAGTWRYRWETSGTIQAAEQKHFVVRPSYA